MAERISRERIERHMSPDRPLHEEATAMVERNYRCDLCRKAFPPDHLVGIEWVFAPAVNHDVIRVRPAQVVEHHLCGVCLEDVARIAKEERS